VEEIEKGLIRKSMPPLSLIEEGKGEGRQKLAVKPSGRSLVLRLSEDSV